MKNKTIAITGATSGIGLEMKKQLETDNKVLNFSRLNGFDLSIDSTAKKVVEAVQENNVDFLFLNAGIYKSGGFTNISPSEISELFNVNLISNIKIIAALKTEILNGLKIVVTLSTASYINGVDEAVYNVTKKALKDYLISVETELLYYSDVKNPFFYFVPSKTKGTKITGTTNNPSPELQETISMMLQDLLMGKKEFIQNATMMDRVFKDYNKDPIKQGISSIEYRKGIKNG